MTHVQRGDVWLCDLGETVGSEQAGKRPVLILQNNIGCKFSPTVTVVSITSKLTKAKMPTHVELRASVYGLEKDSVALGEQVRTISKDRLLHKVTTIDEITVNKIKRAVLLNIEDDSGVNRMLKQPEPRPELMIV